MGVVYDGAKVSALMARINNPAKTKAAYNDKGKALEELVGYIFGSVPDISVTDTNIVANDIRQEVDVACYNDAKDSLTGFPNMILLECKNLSGKVSAPQMTVFVDKLRTCYVPLGVLVSSNGISGKSKPPTAAYAKVSGAMTQGIRVLLLEIPELGALKDTDELALLLKQRYLRTSLLVA